MASDDLKRLMSFLFQDKKTIQKTQIKLSQNDDGYASIEFTDGVVFETKEFDAIDYVVNLRHSIDSSGDYKIVHYKDLEKYYEDIQFLIDHDQRKLNEASKELATGKFKFNYDVDKLQEEFLSSKTRKSKKFEKLKSDYYYIVAYRLFEAKAALDLLNKYKSNSKTVEGYYVAIDKILMKAFRNDENFVKNYLNQRNANDFDLYDFLMQGLSAVQHTSDLLSYYPPQGMDGDRGVKLALDMYRRYAEACVKPLNLLRIAQEIIDGNPSPDPVKGAAENKAILSAALGSMLDCYHPHIRNSESHLSTRIDTVDKKVIITKNSKQVASYTYQEVLDLTNSIGNDFFPALMSALVMELRTILLIITYKSPEYKVALIGIGNT